MSFGLMASGYNTYTVVTSEGKSLVYAGKATQQTGSGDTYYVQDQYSQDKRYEKDSYDSGCSAQANGSDNPCSYSAYTHYGRFKIHVRGENSCGYGSWTFTLPDETSYLTYQINSLDSIPTIFLHSSDENYAGAIISIYQIPSTSNYTLRVLASFPSGQRSAVASKLSLYCFHTKNTSVSSGFGMELYDSSGDVAYNTNQHPAAVGDILSVTALGGTYATPTETSSFLANPPEAASAMTKPAFLSMDWARPIVTYIGPNVTVQGHHGYYGCRDNYSYKSRMIQPFVGSGFNIKSNGEAMIRYVAGTISEFEGGLSTGLTQGYTVAWNNMPLPISVPIIDGADYD